MLLIYVPEFILQVPNLIGWSIGKVHIFIKKSGGVEIESDVVNVYPWIHFASPNLIDCSIGKVHIFTEKSKKIFWEP